MDNESSIVNDVFGVPDGHADTGDCGGDGGGDCGGDAACLCM